MIKGWVITTSPGADDGDTTPWYTSFWEFCAQYSEKRFGTDWHLSPEQSLLLHAESTVVPTQVLIYAKKGTNNVTNLLFGTSILDLKEETQTTSRSQRSHRQGRSSTVHAHRRVS